MNLWKGSMLPGFTKHRDYAHSNFFEHEMDNGAFYDVDPDYILVDRDPIDYSMFEPSRRYYFVDFTTHDRRYTYPFLVPSEPDLSQPNNKRIRETINEYVENPVEGGRDWYDYIDLDSLRTRRHPRVLARKEEQPFLNQKRPRPNRSWTEPEDEERLPRSFSLDEILRGSNGRS